MKMSNDRLIDAAKALAALAFVLVVVLFGSDVAPSQPFPQGSAPESLEYGVPYRVHRVIDGDTIELENGATVRYIGIDTPETHHPDKGVQCFGTEASNANASLVEGKLVTLTKDTSERDRYGRFLAYVHLEDGTFVEQALVESGHAFAYRYYPDVARSTELKNAQVRAQAAGAGLWSACTVTKLKSGRYQTNSLY